MKSQNINLVHLKMKYGEPQAESITQVAQGSLANLIPIIDGNFAIEDAGLEVDALNKFPGPYSSYVYQTLGWKGILDLLGDNSSRSARFRSVVGLYWNGEMRFFSAKIEGNIADQNYGNMGFGFDPIFIPHAAERTFAEMDLEEKNKYSHRSRAFDKMVKYLVELQI